MNQFLSIIGFWGPYLLLVSTSFALIFPVLIGPTFTPPWEAFKLEIPVIFSNLDGVKPVYGENAMKYIDPLNINGPDFKKNKNTLYKKRNIRNRHYG